jgi:oligopeptide/dipeptide ABC transporter ATP-binding protein
VPRLDRVGVADFQSIPGQPPDLLRLPPGCAFAPRCPLASAQCAAATPPLVEAGAGHLAACWNQGQIGSLVT